MEDGSVQLFVEVGVVKLSKGFLSVKISVLEDNFPAFVSLFND